MMKVVNEFYMNRDTVLFCPKYDESGNLYTCILENDQLYRHPLAPTNLMNENLKFYGSNLVGATAGASVILGDVFMSPVIVSESHGLCWFPSKSSSRRDCVWFALHQIKKSRSVGKKKTCVTFMNGSTFIVNISMYSFEMRMKRAYQLIAENERKKREIPTRIAESRIEYHFKQSDCGTNFIDRFRK